MEQQKNSTFEPMDQSTDKRKLLNSWVSEYASHMHAWAHKRTSDHLLAEDLVQDTFVAALHALDGFEGVNPKAWLFSILKHKIMDHFRQKYKMQFVDAGDNQSDMLGLFFSKDQSWNEDRKPGNWSVGDEELLDNEQFRQILFYCMEQLPEQWSVAMKLKYLQEQKGPAICEDLGISQANFWQILHRAKLQLRACIEQNWFAA
ncbi:MAG: sigma-70 family RNA polymerase sigma factor [Bacteroidetes bacterium]|nr:sigma-70 family RNA polymerase sigma factor [Bacteroidota bacterium]MBU1580265.1 sigma-70 family RNA polymerase sigma factor [Bacteroidota bacterium]MBU2465131.1 sigma-70 family RNA polymerase sigma factor [Bacteroidota bacterium]MBU2613879.1 sigma-70 family RNA polymerase sigma factor [Patescibacteria group bacterium]